MTGRQHNPTGTCDFCHKQSKVKMRMELEKIEKVLLCNPVVRKVHLSIFPCKEIMRDYQNCRMFELHQSEVSFYHFCTAFCSHCTHFSYSLVRHNLAIHRGYWQSFHCTYQHTSILSTTHCTVQQRSEHMWSCRRVMSRCKRRQATDVSLIQPQAATMKLCHRGCHSTKTITKDLQRETTRHLSYIHGS